MNVQFWLQSRAEGLFFPVRRLQPSQVISCVAGLIPTSIPTNTAVLCWVASYCLMALKSPREWANLNISRFQCDIQRAQMSAGGSGGRDCCGIPSPGKSCSSQIIFCRAAAMARWSQAGQREERRWKLPRRFFSLYLGNKAEMEDRSYFTRKLCLARAKTLPMNILSALKKCFLLNFFTFCHITNTNFSLIYLNSMC